MFCIVFVLLSIHCGILCTITCLQLLFSVLLCLCQVWDLFYQADKVRDMISAKIQEESLRTYLFRYSAMYDSLSLESLATMFEISPRLVHATISKMIINEELMVRLTSKQPSYETEVRKEEGRGFFSSSHTCLLLV